MIPTHPECGKRCHSRLVVSLLYQLKTESVARKMSAGLVKRQESGLTGPLAAVARSWHLCHMCGSEQMMKALV